MAKEKQLLSPIIDKQLLQYCLVNLERLDVFTCEICNRVYCDNEGLTSHLATHVKCEDTKIHEESTSRYNRSRRNSSVSLCKRSSRKIYNRVNNYETQQKKSIRDRIMFESDDENIDDTFPKTEASEDDSLVSEGDTLSANEYRLFFDCNCDMNAEETLLNPSREVAEEDSQDTTLDNLDINGTENESTSKHILNRSYGKRIPCNICNELVAHESSLKIHKLTHQDKVTNTRDSDDCQDKQIQEVDCSNRQIHEVECSNKQIHEVDCSNKQIEVDYSNKQLEELDCSKKQIQEVDCSNKQIQKFDYQDKQTQKAGLHVCDVCQKAFTKKMYLIKHTQTHTLQKFWKCKFCGDAFKLKEQMQRHQRVHTDLKPYSCNICNIFFRNYSSYSYHKRKVHTKDNPICGTCNRQFCDKSSLLRHLLSVHMTTGYPCLICKMQFGHPIARASHMIIHKGTYKCSCGRSFSKKSDLKYHEALHKKAFECHHCNMRFGKKCHVDRHIKNSCKKAPQLQKKLFECKYCHIKIQRRENLTVHTKSCKLKPYCCPKCRRRYAEKSTLDGHLNRCHKLKWNMGNK